MVAREKNQPARQQSTCGHGPSHLTQTHNGKPFDIRQRGTRLNVKRKAVYICFRRLEQMTKNLRKQGAKTGVHVQFKSKHQPSFPKLCGTNCLNVTERCQCFVPDLNWGSLCIRIKHGRCSEMVKEETRRVGCRCQRALCESGKHKHVRIWIRHEELVWYELGGIHPLDTIDLCTNVPGN